VFNSIVLDKSHKLNKYNNGLIRLLKNIKKKIMKSVFSLLLLLTLSNLNNASAQCIANAGSDVIVCAKLNGMDTVQIGGVPIATGGTPPYTLAWETYHQFTIGQYTFEYNASDILNDTTIANPTIITNPETPLQFTLTITDANGLVCSDSMLVRFSSFGTHLGSMSHYIHQGDSVQLNLGNLIGGISPVQYLWRPNHGLTDSTSLTTWAKPDTSISYYITATDSAGCSETGAPVHHVNVTPVSVNSIDNNSRIKLYPNPTNDFLNINIESTSNEPTTIELIDVNGRIIKTLSTTEKRIKWNLEKIAKGSYLCKLSNNSNLIKTQRIIIE